MEQRRRRRRFRCNMRLLLLRVLLPALIIVGAIFAICAINRTPKDASAAPVELSSKAAPEATSSLESIDATEPTKTIIVAPQKKAAKGLLVLVNWEHPGSGERPENLVALSEAFSDEVLLTNGAGSVHREAGAAAKEMFLEARRQGVGRYKITSGYRSASYQEQLFQAQVKKNPQYGNDPFSNPVKVMPGKMSEHTTGLALDILSESHSTADDAYAETQEGKWLAQHAPEYGFIQRYPKQKEHLTGVIFEPWHYRYVGKKDALAIAEAGLCLEEYVASEE